MKNWLIALLSVFCAAWAAQLVADSDPGPVRKRFPSALEAEQSLMAVAKAEPVSLDLADTSRMLATGQLPQWTPTPTSSVEEAGKPPSGKAFGPWDWLKNFFGF